MIDWVTIVRHSRRRFSNYISAVPIKVRTCKKSGRCDIVRSRSLIRKSRSRSTNTVLCICCWNKVSSHVLNILMKNFDWNFTELLLFKYRNELSNFVLFEICSTNQIFSNFLEL